MSIKTPVISAAMGIRYQRDDLSLLKRAVSSVLRQSELDFELIICEQGSTAQAKKQLREFSLQDKRIRFVDGAGAGTLGEKLNRCIAAARGDYIARMDDDDMSFPDRFKRQADFLNTHPEIAFVGCNVEVERDGSSIGIREFPERPTVRDFLFTQPYIHPALMFRRAVLEKAGGYDPRPCRGGCEDYDLLLRLYAAGFQGANLPQPQLTYTLPPRGTQNRTMSMRWNEVRTRWANFKALGLLPWALPYVVKPVAVGLLPEELVERLKARRQKR